MKFILHPDLSDLLSLRGEAEAIPLQAGLLRTCLVLAMTGSIGT